MTNGALPHCYGRLLGVTPYVWSANQVRYSKKFGILWWLYVIYVDCYDLLLANTTTTSYNDYYYYYDVQPLVLATSYYVMYVDYYDLLLATTSGYYVIYVIYSIYVDYYVIYVIYVI